MKVEIKSIPLNQLDRNVGQIAGLPVNPRYITKTKFKQLRSSIESNEKMLQLRELLVFAFGEATDIRPQHYVVIAGNMRLEALKSLNVKAAPCKIIDPETSIEDLKKIAILDNASYGEWDFDILVNDFECDSVCEYGIQTTKKPKKPMVKIVFQTEEDRDRFMKRNEEAIIKKYGCKVKSNKQL